jgi:predicted Zn-dependent protease
MSAFFHHSRPGWLTLLLAFTGLLIVGVLLGWSWFELRLARHNALQFVRQGRFAEAEPLLHRVLARAPNDLEVVKALAHGQLETGQLAEAGTSLERWCDLQPNDPEAWQNRFDLHLRLGQRDLALGDAQRLVELESGNTELGQRIVFLYLSLDRPQEAVVACRRFLKEQPDHPQLRYLLAEALHAQGEDAEAQTVLEPLVRDYPNLTSALMLRAMLLVDVDGRPAEAIPLFRKVAVLDQSRQQVARYHLGQALARVGQTEEANRVLSEVKWLQVKKRLIEYKHPDNPELRAREAEALLGSGQDDEAYRVLEQVLKGNPNYALAHRLLAVYYEKKGQPAKAAEHRRQAANE